MIAFDVFFQHRISDRRTFGDIEVKQPKPAE